MKIKIIKRDQIQAPAAPAIIVQKARRVSDVRRDWLADARSGIEARRVSDVQIFFGGAQTI